MSGSVLLLGQELVGKDEDALARLRRGAVGVVFQAFHLLPNMTAFKNAPWLGIWRASPTVRNAPAQP